MDHAASNNGFDPCCSGSSMLPESCGLLNNSSNSDSFGPPSGVYTSSRIITRKNRAPSCSEIDLVPHIPQINWKRRTFSDLSEPPRFYLQEYTEIGKLVRFSVVLGEGAYGTVWKCTRIQDGRLLACKSISKSKLKLPRDALMLRNEAQILQMMQECSGALGFYGLYEDKNEVYLLLEYCAGGDLFSRIKERRFYSEPEAAAVCKRLATSLKFAHDHGIMHRDVKPENIFLVSKFDDTRIRLGDFGSAVLFDSDKKLSEFAGSSFYMSPSVLNGRYGPEADVWSLGVVLYILLCGVPPFQGKDEKVIYHRILNQDLEFKHPRWKYVSDRAKSVVTGLLEKDEDKRMTLQEVLDHEWIKTPCLCQVNHEKDIPVASPVEAVPVLKARQGLQDVHCFSSLQDKFANKGNVQLGIAGFRSGGRTPMFPLYERKEIDSIEDKEVPH